MAMYLVVADSTRARLLTWQASSDPVLDGSSRLVELESLTNPEGRLQDREVFSNEITNNRTTGPGPAHAYDDHRDAHRLESFRRFARYVAEQASEHVTRERLARVVLICETRVQHALRQTFEAELPHGLELTVINENLAALSTTQLQHALARLGLVPAPEKGPSVEQYVPRGQPVPGSIGKRD
jgi:hypothetical protein